MKKRAKKNMVSQPRCPATGLLIERGRGKFIVGVSNKVVHGRPSLVEKSWYIHRTTTDQRVLELLEGEGYTLKIKED